MPWLMRLRDIAGNRMYDESIFIEKKAACKLRYNKRCTPSACIESTREKPFLFFFLRANRVQIEPQ